LTAYGALAAGLTGFGLACEPNKTEKAVGLALLASAAYLGKVTANLA
jgi:hypothetical protein